MMQNDDSLNPMNDQMGGGTDKSDEESTEESTPDQGGTDLGGVDLGGDGDNSTEAGEEGAGDKSSDEGGGIL